MRKFAVAEPAYCRYIPGGCCEKDASHARAIKGIVFVRTKERSDVLIVQKLFFGGGYIESARSAARRFVITDGIRLSVGIIIEVIIEGSNVRILPEVS